ncbi:MAG TPA: PIG-L family deacetylase [bacterium]|nr:PIG-L family deacetylase [bacterium]
MIENWQRILVFSAHPDDEILGVGGTIAKLSKSGKEVYVVTFAIGETSYSSIEMKEKMRELRLKEAEECNKVLGIKERIILYKPNQGITNDRETYQECVKIIRKYKPDVIFTHYKEDKHRDHRAVWEITDEARWKAAENVLADFGTPWYTQELYYYEVIELFTYPSLLIDITDTLERKVEAMKTQSSQFPVLPGVIEYIEGLGKVRGYLRGTKYAEAFLSSNFIARLE